MPYYIVADADGHLHRVPVGEFLGVWPQKRKQPPKEEGNDEMLGRFSRTDTDYWLTRIRTAVQPRRRVGGVIPTPELNISNFAADQLRIGITANSPLLAQLWVVSNRWNYLTITTEFSNRPGAEAIQTLGRLVRCMLEHEATLALTSDYKLDTAVVVNGLAVVGLHAVPTVTDGRQNLYHVSLGGWTSIAPSTTTSLEEAVQAALKTGMKNRKVIEVVEHGIATAAPRGAGTMHWDLRGEDFAPDDEEED